MTASAILSSWDWGSVPDWIVAVTAIAAAWYGGVQLYHLRQGQKAGVAAQETAARHAAAAVTQAELAAEQQKITAEQHTEYVRIEEANLLLRIDSVYEGAEMRPARMALRNLLNAIDDRNRKRPGETTEVYRRRVMCRYLEMLRHAGRHALSRDEAARARGNAARQEYELLMQLPGYIETMGMLWEEGYVSERRLLGLYDSVVIQAIGSTLTHIERRQKTNAYYLEMAIRLYKRALVWRPDAPDGSAREGGKPG